MRNLKCDGCGAALEENELKKVWPNIPDLGQRLDPGGVVPHGECPECGALVYKDDTIRIMRCRVCSGSVLDDDMREHLLGHNPNTLGMDYEEIRDQFEWVNTMPCRVARLDVLTAIEEETEFPGEMPEAIEKTVKSFLTPPTQDTARFTSLLRFIVKKTKENIRKRVMEIE